MKKAAKRKTARTHTPKADGIYVLVSDARRGKIIEALATMDDEAFSWLVLAMPPSAMLHGGTVQIWPDGLGGFKDREKIEAARTAAQAWIDASQPGTSIDADAAVQLVKDLNQRKDPQ